MEMTLQEMARALKALPAAKIYFHKKPDGDAVGSACGLALGLTSLGIPCELLCTDPVPESYTQAVAAVPVQSRADAVGITVDCSTQARLGRYSDREIALCIDHHGDNTVNAPAKFVRPEASSCCELVFALLQEMGVNITEQMADFLYTGLYTDTSGFRAVSTNADSLAAAAALAAKGAHVVEIGRKFGLKKSRARMEMEALMTANFHYLLDGRILSTYYNYPDRQRIGTTNADMETINLLVEQVEGVEIGIVVREGTQGHCRVSVRTEGNLNAAELCARFGGGGHDNSAGCEVDGTPAQVVPLLEQAALAYYRHMRG